MDTRFIFSLQDSLHSRYITLTLVSIFGIPVIPMFSLFGLFVMTIISHFGIFVIAMISLSGITVIAYDIALEYEFYGI